MRAAAAVQVMCVTGGIPQLGNWQADQVLVMSFSQGAAAAAAATASGAAAASCGAATGSGGGTGGAAGGGGGGNGAPQMWEAEVRVPYGTFQFAYKYAIQSAEGKLCDKSHVYNVYTLNSCMHT